MIAHKTKKAIFKIWPKGFKQDVFFSNYFPVIPVDLPTFFSYNYPFVPANKPIRLRLVCVRARNYAYLSAKAIEAFRKVIAPYFRKKSYYNIKFNILVYPYMPLTKKPAEVRIGGGKGAKVRDFICPVKPGQILFTTTSLNPLKAKKLISYASRKLGISVSISFILKKWHY